MDVTTRQSCYTTGAGHVDKPVALLLHARPLLSKSKTFVAMLSVTIAPLKQTVVLSLTKSLEGTDAMVDVILRAVITCDYKLVTYVKKHY